MVGLADDPPKKEPPTPPPNTHTAQHWDGSSNLDPGHGTFSNSNPFTAPPVPGGKGASGKGISVDTPSMEILAGNIDKLIDPVKKALSTLPPNLMVAPGAFYHANKIRSSVTGANGDDDGALKTQFVKVLSDLVNGLTDISGGVRTLIASYKNNDDLSRMKAKDLSDAMSGATDDFNGLMSDGGGSPAMGGGGSGSDSKNT